MIAHWYFRSRLARYYDRLATTPGAFHLLAFLYLMIANLFRILARS